MILKKTNEEISFFKASPNYPTPHDANSKGRMDNCSSFRTSFVRRIPCEPNLDPFGLGYSRRKNIISPPESTRSQTSSSSATSTPQMPPAKTAPSGPASMAEKLGPSNASSSPAPAATPPSSLAAPAPPQRASSTSTGRTSPANHLRKISSPTSPKTSQKLNQAPSLEVHLPLRSQDLQLDREIGSCQSGTLFTNLQNAD